MLVSHLRLPTDVDVRQELYCLILCTIFLENENNPNTPTIKFCFRKQNEGVNTRNSTFNLLNIPFRKSKVEKLSSI